MPALDLFAGESPGYSAPALNGEAVTPNDGTDLNYTTRAIWVGGAGNISVIFKGDRGQSGQTVLLSGIPAGTLLPIAVTRVRATGTTATLIVALR